MRVRQTLSGLLSLSGCLIGVRGSCYANAHNAVTPGNGLHFETDQFDMYGIVASLFSLLDILKREVVVPMGNGYYKAQGTDHTCVWLGYQTPFGDIIDNKINFYCCSDIFI